MIDFYDQCCCTSKKSAAGAASRIYTSQAGVRSNHNCRLATCALLDVIRCWLKLEHYSATVPTRVIITRPGVGLIHLDSSFKKKKKIHSERITERIYSPLFLHRPIKESHARRERNEWSFDETETSTRQDKCLCLHQMFPDTKQSNHTNKAINANLISAASAALACHFLAPKWRGKESPKGINK